MPKDREFCKHGHRLAGRNLALYDGKRKCRTCIRRWSRTWYSKNYVRKRPLVHSYPEAPKSVVSWAAGLFEGEGTISIARGGSGGYTRSSVQVSNTDREIIDVFQKHWPGHLVHFKPRASNARRVYKWELNSRPKICAFLRIIESEVKTSRARARISLMLEAEAFRLQGTRKPGYKKKCHEFRKRMRALNRRGIH